MRMKKRIVGTKDFHGSVDITDPCYYRDTWCRMNDIKIKDGEYACVVWYATIEGYDGEQHEKVGMIGIYHDGIIPAENMMKKIGEIGVDAGLAGFFHNKPDFTSDEWFEFCNAIEDKDYLLSDLGFVSVTAYGDGVYPVLVHKSKGEITALEIKFV